MIRLRFDNADHGPGAPVNNMARKSRKIQKTTIFYTLETKNLEALYARLESGVFETKLK
jgi:hypothetical protein